MGILRWHTLGFVLISLLFTSISTPPWLFWLMCGWSVALLVHWLYAKSLAVDEKWAERRAREVQYKSYDFGHIQQIKAAYETNARSDKPIRIGGQ